MVYAIYGSEAESEAEVSGTENSDILLWNSDDDCSCVFVTKTNGIGINSNGAVIVKPLDDWHQQDKRIAELEKQLAELEAQAAVMRDVVGHFVRLHGNPDALHWPPS